MFGYIISLLDVVNYNVQLVSTVYESANEDFVNITFLREAN